MDKYIISGIGPSDHGAGRLVKELIKFANQSNPDIKVIAFYSKKNKLFKFLKNSFFGHYLKLIYYKLIQKSNSARQIQNIKHSTVLLLHPQTLGFDNFKILIENKNKIFLYVLDNSFFCMKSLNYANGHKACFDCLGNINTSSIQKNGCKPSPVMYSLQDNTEFLKYLNGIKMEVNFLAQNYLQQNLLFKHFGDQINSDVVGMYTSEFSENKIYNAHDNFKFDFVYHGSLELAKGVLYFIELAKAMPDNSFFIPYDSNLVKNKLNLKTLPTNINFENQTWESGLEDTIKHSKIVVCPSLWSAPIEGAFLKSIMVNGCVAVVNTEFAYSNEFTSDQIIKLNSELVLSLSLLNEVLQNKVKRNKIVFESQAWFLNYVNQKEMSQAKLFERAFCN